MPCSLAALRGFWCRLGFARQIARADFLLAGKPELRASLLFAAPVLYGIAIEVLASPRGHPGGALAISISLGVLSALATGITGGIVKRIGQAENAGPRKGEPYRAIGRRAPFCPANCGKARVIGLGPRHVLDRSRCTFLEMAAGSAGAALLAAHGPLRAQRVCRGSRAVAAEGNRRSQPIH